MGWCNELCHFLQLIEREEKYKNVVHQNDVWHGGKSLAKKINAVSMNKLYEDYN